MFDLVDKLSKSTPNHTQQKENKCAFLYQTAACKDLVHKAFRFEGLVEPITVNNQEKNYPELHMHSSVEVVIVELNKSQSVVEDAKNIAHQLPTHVSVVVVGSEDAISTIRALKQLGFYYLFWPATDKEIMEFYHGVRRNRQQQSGVASNRKAKQVAFLGVKGGVGTSLIASEVARSLGRHHKTPTLLVDHTYTGSNIDVLLGLQKFSKRSVRKGTLVSSIDGDFATSLVQRLERNLAILGLESDAFTRAELHEYTQALKEQVVKNHSFVIEDYSHTVTTNEEFDRAVAEIDTLVVVFDATVSSLRELNRVVSELEMRYPELPLLTVMNQSRPDNAASISMSDVSKYFGRKADCKIEFDHKANHYLLQGHQLIDTKSEMQQGLSDLVALLVGDKPQQKRSWVQELFNR
ncbi:AAA family ATPase [Vibrio campbellii]